MLRITFHAALESNVNYTSYKLSRCLSRALSPPLPGHPQRSAAPSGGRRAPVAQRQPRRGSVRDEASAARRAWGELRLSHGDAESLCESLGCAGERWKVKRGGSLVLGTCPLRAAVGLPRAAACLRLVSPWCPRGAGLVLAPVGSGQSFRPPPSWRGCGPALPVLSAGHGSVRAVDRRG